MGLSPSSSQEEQKQRASFNDQDTQCSTDTAGHVLQVISPGLLTALQSLFPAREHSAGEHASWGQALQCQDTLTLFSGRHRGGVEVKVCFLLWKKKRHIKEPIFTSYWLCGSLVLFKTRHLKIYLYRENILQMTSVLKSHYVIVELWPLLHIEDPEGDSSFITHTTCQSCCLASPVIKTCVPRDQPHTHRPA